MANKSEKISRAAQHYLQKGQIGRAIEAYQELLAEDPDDIRTLLQLGDLHLQRGEADEAAGRYGQVAQRYVEQGFLLKAVAVYKQILRFAPKRSDVHTRLAEVYAQLGLAAEAANQYRLLHEVYVESGGTDEATQVLRQLRDLEPDNIAVRLKLAEALVQQGSVTEARDCLVQAALELRAQHRSDEFAAVAERLLQLEGADAQILGALAAVYDDKGQHAERDAVLRQLRQLESPAAVEVATGAGAAPEWGGGDFGDNEVTAITPVPQEEASAVVAQQVDAELGHTDIFSAYLKHAKAEQHLHDIWLEAAGAAAPEQERGEQTAALPAVEVELTLEKMADEAAMVVDLSDAAAHGAPNADNAGALLYELDHAIDVAAPPTATEAVPAALQAGAEAVIFGQEEDYAASSARGEEPIAAVLDQIHIMLEQGRDSDARAALEELLQEHPAHPEVLALNVLLEPLDAGEAGPASARAEQTPRVSAAQPTGETGPWAIAAATAPEGAEAPAWLKGAMDSAPGQQQVALEDVLKEFRRQVAAQIAINDYETHFNLGMAYKEMGLLDDAVREFSLCTGTPSWQVGALHLLGLCEMQRSNARLAIDYFRDAERAPRVTAPQRVALHYELGNAYEAIGRFPEAMRYFEKVVIQEPDFRDVEYRLRACLYKRNAAKNEALLRELDEMLLDPALAKSG